MRGGLLALVLAAVVSWGGQTYTCTEVRAAARSAPLWRLLYAQATASPETKRAACACAGRLIQTRVPHACT